MAQDGVRTFPLDATSRRALKAKIAIVFLHFETVQADLRVETAEVRAAVCGLCTVLVLIAKHIDRVVILRFTRTASLSEHHLCIVAREAHWPGSQ